MAYHIHFQHADDVVAHLNTIIPGLTDPLLQSKYVGLMAVAAITVYELAIKTIFIDFGKKKHKVLGSFTENYFNRINGRITLKNIKDDYVIKFGNKYLHRFEKTIDQKAKQYLSIHRRDIRSSYANLIIWRNDFAHEGRFNTTATYQEVVQSYEDGKEIIHCLAQTMNR
jgi:hypothetical protein